jgi:hypothetical protein
LSSYLIAVSDPPAKKFCYNDNHPEYGTVRPLPNLHRPFLHPDYQSMKP